MYIMEAENAKKIGSAKLIDDLLKTQAVYPAKFIQKLTQKKATRDRNNIGSFFDTPHSAWISNAIVRYLAPSATCHDHCVTSGRANHSDTVTTRIAASHFISSWASWMERNVPGLARLGTVTTC
jgi:hypothetical protein